MATNTKKATTSAAKVSTPSITLRLSRGRTLKIIFRPRIRIAKLLVKLLATATGLFTFAVATANAAPPANALPTGGQVVYGNTSFQQTNNTLNVNQASQSTIINWQSFDIGAQSIVNFNQLNSSSVALNRILGNNASQIYGQLNANGHVFLLNPNGMLFAPGSQVSVGGLLASTMQMSDSDFISGNYRLTNAGAGNINSQGNIYANTIALVGNNISNSGNMYATNVSLVAGDTVAVDISGNGLIRARIESPALKAQISNSGNINALRQVVMSAGESRDTINSLVNNSGVIRATGLSNEGGVITLQGGKTLNSGVLDVSSNTGKGGTVHVLGEHVGIVESGSVIASGATGGGTILVGGDFQGKNSDVFNADRTYIGANTTLNADAINTGNGGKVIVWADDITRAYGNISARGGAVAGNGGFVEVSGKRNLDYQAQTDTSAPHGQMGTLLLDPDNINIDSIGGGTFLDANVFAVNPGATITLFNGLFSTASNVILQANVDINFLAPINMTLAGSSLTAQAGRSIIVSPLGSITTNGGAVNLTAGDAGASPLSTLGALTLNANINTNGGSVLLTNNGTGGITQALTAGITASDLAVTSVGNASLTGNNTIANNIAANITGLGNSFTYSSSAGINVGTVGALNGITTSNGNATLTSATNLNVNETINLGTGDLALTAQVGSIGIIASGPLTRTITARNINASALTEGDIIIGDSFNSGLPTLSVSGNITLLAQDSIAGGNINISSANINHTGSAAGTFTANAENNITLQSTAITSAGSAFAVALTSYSDAVGNGVINLSNSSIDSNGGNITLAGGLAGAGYANSTVTGDGINLNNSSLTASGGNIALRGRSEKDDGIAGIFALDSSITTTGTGTISIDGVGAPFSVLPARSAVTLSNTVVSAVSDITLTGVNTFANLSAVRLINGTSISNSTGNINITGSSFTPSAASVAGIEVSGAAVIQNTAAGNVDLTGTVTGTGSANRGILVSGPGTIIGVADGILTLDGDASAATTTANSDGILINAGAIIQSTGAGGVSLIGKSALGGTTQAGIAIADTGTQVRSLGSGFISLDGQGNGTGVSSFGVVLFNGAAINGAGTGTGITQIYAKANNTTSVGLAVDGPSTISTNRVITIDAGNNDTSPGGDQIRFDSAGGASITGSTSTIDGLRIKPINLTHDIALGDNSNTLGVFSLNSADLAAISNFTEVTIGSATHTGAFNVAAGGLDSFTLANNNSAVYIQNASANVDFLGATTFGSALSVENFAGNIALSSLTSLNGSIGVFANDNLTIKAGSAIQSVIITNLVANVDLDAGGTGGGDFINLAGAGALVSSGANKWKVYSLDVAGNTYGGLLSGNQAVWGTTFTGFLATPGNRYVFAETPTVVVTSTNTTKTYGQNGVPIVANSYSTTGFVNAATFGNVFTQDTAANALAGSAMSLGSPIAQNVGSYAIDVSPISATTGYTLSLVSTGSLTVNPAPLNITATGVNKAFDGNTVASVVLADNRLAGDLLSFTYAANFVDSAIGTGKQIDVIGITLSGADALNYSLACACAVAFADITGATAITPPSAQPAPTSGADESDRTQADTIDKTQDLELVLIPVKIKLPTEDEYIVATGISGKELSCK